jgi:hypothetical protein
MRSPTPRPGGRRERWSSKSCESPGIPVQRREGEQHRRPDESLHRDNVKETAIVLCSVREHSCLTPCSSARALGRSCSSEAPERNP